MASQDLEILAVTLMDIRSTIESMRRSVTNAQSSIEQCRHKPTEKILNDIGDCLVQLKKESATVTESANAGADTLQALIDAAAKPGANSN